MLSQRIKRATIVLLGMGIAIGVAAAIIWVPAGAPVLEHGATTSERATDGTTALKLAKRWVGKEIAAILVDAGAVE
jgi:hypothetical protein